MTGCAARAVVLVGVLVGVLVLGASAVRAQNAAPFAEAGPDRQATVGEVVRFDGSASADPDGAVIRHRWSFGDGGGADGAAVRHAYEAPGTYRVRLHVEDTGRPPAIAEDTALVTVRARPNAAPRADAGPDRTVRVGEPVLLDGRRSRDPDGAILAYRWQIGGRVLHGPRVAHVFHRPGVKTVALEIRDDLGARARDRLEITVRPATNLPPVAEAGPDRTVAPGEPVRLDARESRDPDGALIGWEWDMGDGTTRSGPAVEHRYAAPGRYTLRLIVEDGSGRPNARAEDTAEIVVNAPPIAEAGPDRRSRVRRQVFDAGGSRDPDGRVIRHLWDFGDGTTAEGARVAHIFRGPGEWGVTLTVTDDSGAANATATDRARVVIEPPPLAEAGPLRTAAPGEAVAFDAGPAGGAALVAVWLFGDGTRAVDRSVEKRFHRAGRHAVRLELRRAEDGRVVASDETAVLVNAAPVARAGPDLRTAPGEVVRLDAGGSFDPDGEIHRYVWTVDGETRRSPVPVWSRRFDAPGRYEVVLTVIDGSGAPNDRATAGLVVAVNGPPVAAAGPDRVVADRAVSFDAGGSRDPDGDPLTYRWAFGDGTTGEGLRVGHVYAGPGRYTATLEVDDGTGFANARARDTAVVRVNAAPVAEAGPNLAVCAGNVVTFDARESADPDGDALTHLWVFDDGVTLAGQEARRSFESPGTQAATLVVDDGSGVPNAAARDRVFISVDPRPRAEAGPDRQVCAGETIAFDGTGSRDLDGAVNRYRWSFGDGATAEGAHPSHAYAEPGRYRVSLAIEGDPLPRCDNTDVDWAGIEVLPAPRVRIQGPAAISAGEAIRLSAVARLPSGDGEVLSHSWDLGDGTTARGPVVTHRYDRPGAYVVRLRIRTSGARASCAAAEGRHGVRVNARPEAVVSVPEVIAAHRPVRLDGSASRDPDGVLTAYRWIVSDGTRLSGVAPEHVFRRPGLYEVALEVEDESGQANSIARRTERVEVVATPALSIEGAGVSCVGEPLTLRARLQGAPPGLERRVSWDLGDGTRSDLRALTHIYRDPGHYTVTAMLDASVRGAALRGEASRRHRVNAPPVAVAGPDIVVCPGAVVDFHGGRSRDPDGDALTGRWEFGDGASAEGRAVSHRFDVPGLYRARLTVEDGAGSACSAATTTRLVRANAAPKAEAGSDVTARLDNGVAQVTLDGGGSRDPEGRPLRHLWTVEDGDPVEGRTATLSFREPGRYRARLHVSDGTGLSCGVDTDVAVITILP